ncbi:VanZ family protein [Ferrimonas sp. SCSIO 43195]|uniref:VanZ family protein n=1 Tax=Ferrimonas sp. SCSIO 43195 TaxID=2822844 RepID=UPI00207508B5|nr:VanZ family protein [Ferrimonas sp. SCSIO 43195]USD36176.1 VanZ family protein [Ferrimonas sp. SCSIO 43195]
MSSTGIQKSIGLLGIGFFGFILWIIYLANSGGDSVFFDLVRQLPYGDKLGHFCLFGLLTLAANLGTGLKTLPVGRWRWYLGTTLVSLFVLLEELSQLLLPRRTFDVTDLAADLVGIVLFTWVSKKLAATRWLCRRHAES